MAKQRIHNSRSGRGSGASGASWISYSDMMASLLLVFVLILCMSLYQYFTMLESKTQELEQKEALLAVQQTTLDEQSATLTQQQATLTTQQSKLNEQAATLAAQQSALDSANASLATSQQTALDAATSLLQQQQDALAAQTQKIDDLVGVRSEIIARLSVALSSANLRATVDKSTGDIQLDSAVFFETGSYKIKEQGRALLDQFIPVYLSVLLRDEYSEYLGEIIIEGHTDSTGSYINNLELSQNRALAVAKYCLEMPSLTNAQRTLLRKILTATGRSNSSPIYNADGTENLDASRRVEFKFSLRDAEMIDEMNRLLSGQ